MNQIPSIDGGRRKTERERDKKVIIRNRKDEKKTTTLNLKSGLWIFLLKGTTSI